MQPSWLNFILTTVYISLSNWTHMTKSDTTWSWCLSMSEVKFVFHVNFTRNIERKSWMLCMIWNSVRSTLLTIIVIIGPYKENETPRCHGYHYTFWYIVSKHYWTLFQYSDYIYLLVYKDIIMFQMVEYAVLLKYQTYYLLLIFLLFFWSLIHKNEIVWKLHN